jgi:hypothetical protein
MLAGQPELARNETVLLARCFFAYDRGRVWDDSRNAKLRGKEMSRIKRVASWCAILTTFVAFAAVLLGGMAGMGSAATISQAASSLLKSKDASKGSLVVVKADDKHSRIDGLLGSKPKDAVCWVTNTQANVIRALWTTTTTTVDARYSLLTINAPHVTDKEMRTYLSGGVKCQLVQEKWAFFVPLDGAVS